MKRSFVFAAVAGAMVSTAIAAPTASADCANQIYDEALPVTAASPASGSAIAPTAGSVPFELVSPLQHGEVSVRVSSQDVAGGTGVLSDQYQTDFFLLPESMTDFGTYRGDSLAGSFWWPDKPGTYYWQAMMLYSDYSTYPQTCHLEASPVYTLTVAAPAPPPAPTPIPTPPPVKQPTPKPKPKPAPKYWLSRGNARVWVRYAVLDGLYHGRARTKLGSLGVRGCAQTGTHRFRCQVFWHRPPYSWSGRVTVGAVNGRTGAFSYGADLTRRGGTVLIRRGKHHQRRRRPARSHHVHIGYTDWTNARPLKGVPSA